MSILSSYKKIKSSKLFHIFIGDRCSNLWLYGFLIFLNLIAALFEGVSFGFIFAAFSGLKPSGDLSSGVFQKLFAAGYQGEQLFFFSVFLSILCQAMRSGLCYISTRYATKFALRVQKKIQTEIYSQILRFSYSYLTRLKIGDLLESARAPVNSVMQVLDALNRFVVALLNSLAIVVLMVFLNPMLTAITVALFGFFSFAQRAIIKNILQSSNAQSKHLMEANQDTSQMLQGIKVVHSFFQQSKIKIKIRDKIEDILNTTEKMYTLSNIVAPLNEMISVLVLGLVLVFATLAIGIESESILAILMTFLIISYRLSTRLQNGLAILGTAGTYFGPIVRMHDILDDSNKEFIQAGGVELTDPIEEILVEELGFCYCSDHHYVLKNISFAVPKGAMIGIVGLSGSGKSSLIDLILRLYEPVQGRILVNNKDIQAFSLSSWRAKFGVVAQEAFLFDESIEENIRFGVESASSEQIMDAARSAGIHELIQKLPRGLQTVVGERGVCLSGGERQRIALARALLRNPEVLILDEATSNLDSQSEHYIQNALAEIQKTKTIIVVAHRLSTIVDSDNILVVENGSIIESGTHEELLKRTGRYFKLWKMQTKKHTSDHLVSSSI